MKLSAPVHILKGRAKELKLSRGMTMIEALNQIARKEGYNSWGLLQSKVKDFVPQTADELLAYLHPGDMLLISARPGLGKTVLALQLITQAIEEQRSCFFFSFDYTPKTFATKMSDLKISLQDIEPHLHTYFSDDICADYIIHQTDSTAKEGSLIVIDYLQLLDQKRSNPPLQQQIETLKKHAREKRCVLIFIAQIDRAFEQAEHSQASLRDIRLPNPLDLSLFNKSVFVQAGQIHM